MDIALIIISVAIGYLLGSVSFSVIVSKIAYKGDVREHGSGNAGATNMARVYGLKGAIFVLLADFGKCVLSMFLAKIIGETQNFTLGNICMSVAGGACLIGHAFPLFFKFKGGKGISVGAGLAVMCDWRVLLIILGVFIIVVLISKIVSLSSVCAAIALFISGLVFYFTGIFGGAITLPEMILCVLAPVLVIWLHRQNIARLVKGQEKKLTFKK